MAANDLASLGWNADLIQAFEAHAEKGLVPGRVSLEHNHVYRVLTADGEWLAAVDLISICSLLSLGQLQIYGLN